MFHNPDRQRNPTCQAHGGPSLAHPVPGVLSSRGPLVLQQGMWDAVLSSNKMPHTHARATTHPHPHSSLGHYNKMASQAYDS